jgi:enoyl-CoA hydratase
MGKAEFVQVDREGSIAIVTMNRAPVNAVTRQFYQEIIDTFDGLGADKSVFAAILCSGVEKAWCAGNDVNDFAGMTPDNGHIKHRLVRNAFFAIYDCAVPVIAAVNSYAMGTGLGFAACCDVVVASERASFGAPEIKVGVLGCVKFLSRLVPEMVMRRMLFSGEHATAAEMARWGAVARVVPHDQLMAAAMEQARIIAEKAPSTIRLAKELFNRVEYMDIKLGFEIENSYSRRAAAYEDSKEAQRAFLEKRKPQFKGC